MNACIVSVSVCGFVDKGNEGWVMKSFIALQLLMFIVLWALFGVLNTHKHTYPLPVLCSRHCLITVCVRN